MSAHSMSGWWNRFKCGWSGHRAVDVGAACWAHAVIGSPIKCSRCGLVGRRMYGNEGSELLKWGKQ